MKARRVWDMGYDTVFYEGGGGVGIWKNDTW